MDRPVLSSMVHIQFVLSRYVHGGFISQLSDFKHLLNGLKIIQEGLRDAGFRFDSPSVILRVFGVYLERYLE